MLEFLKVYHRKAISFSTHKRYLKKVIIFPRPLLGRRINANEVKEIAQKKLYRSGSNLGDRSVLLENCQEEEKLG